MTVSTVEPVQVLPPPSAYPHPVTLPVSPHGDPDAARALATAYRDFADALEVAARRIDAIVADLALRWHGGGAHALRVPSDLLDHNLRTLAGAARAAADHLEDYAKALHHAQHHHGWSIGKIVAIGAVVTITAVAVVVTVGAAAPVGTVAALEVGEAIAGAEAAAAGATAAETAATTGLSLAGQTMTAGLRTLTTVAMPHLVNGAVGTTIDVGFHLLTGKPLTAGQLSEDFLAATLTSGTIATTRKALHATEAFRGASALGQAALDTATLTATLTADDGLRQYATDGHLDPTRLTEAALLTAVTGSISTLRNPTGGTGAVSEGSNPPASVPLPPVMAVPVVVPPTGQTIEEILGNGYNVALHDGPDPWGHVGANHVGKSLSWLKARLAADPEPSSASSFFDLDTAQRAITEAIRRSPDRVALLLNGSRKVVVLHKPLDYDLGPIALRDGRERIGRKIAVVLILVEGRIVVRTAYVE